MFCKGDLEVDDTRYGSRYKENLQLEVYLTGCGYKKFFILVANRLFSIDTKSYIGLIILFFYKAYNFFLGSTTFSLISCE